MPQLKGNTMPAFDLYSAHRLNKLSTKRKFYLPLKSAEILASRSGRYPYIYDVGGFIGSFIDETLKYVNPCSIFCFEAFEGNANKIRRKHSSPSILVENCVVSMKSGDVIFSIPKDSFINAGENTWGGRALRGGMGHLSKTEKQIRVRSVRLEDYIDNIGKGVPPALIKIDVQGGEMDVINSLGKYLDSTDLIYFECQLKHGRDWHWIETLRGMGFSSVMDGFQFGVSADISKSNISDMCAQIGIMIEQFDSNNCIYGRSLEGERFFDHISKPGSISDLFTYFQTDILAFRSNSEDAFAAVSWVLLHDQ